MSDNTHAAMCVYCGETIIYDTREVTDMAAAHAQIVEHDQQCPKNPLVGRIAFLNQQNTALQEQCDEYRDHLAHIAEMTGNSGDIGAAHEGVNAVIEERDALARFADQVVTALFDSPGCDIDGKCAEDWLLEAGIIFGEPYEPNGKHSQAPVEDVEEGEELLQCQQWFLKAVAAAKAKL